MKHLIAYPFFFLFVASYKVAEYLDWKFYGIPNHDINSYKKKRACSLLLESKPKT